MTTFKKSSTRGFTLIELLVVTTIVMVVLGGGLVAYFNFNERQEVINTAKEIRTLAHVAQAKARAKALPGGTCTTLLSDYELRTDLGSEIRVYGRCHTNGARAIAPNQSVLIEGSSMSIPSGITVEVENIGTGSTDTVVAFSPLGGGLKIPDGVLRDEYLIEFRVSKSSGTTATFTIDSSGQISDLEVN